MSDVVRSRSNLITASQQNHLRFEFHTQRDGKRAKRALQDICEYYERGKRLRDSDELRPFVHQLLTSEEVLLRRWSIKALGLMRYVEDADLITRHIATEPDMEARTWGVASIINARTTTSVETILREADLSHDKAYDLAARLYATNGWLRSNAAPVSVELRDDPVALKWATFLVGYDRTDDHLFHPRHKDNVFVAELNQHDVDEIAEYSIWSIYQRPTFDIGDVRIPLHEFKSPSENVRKWLYQVATQSAEKIDLCPDMLWEWRTDESRSAREGLARGVRDLKDERYEKQLLDWAQGETDGAVRGILLSSLAARSENGPSVREFLEVEFKKDVPEGELRRKLLAASSGLPMAGSFDRLVAQESRGVNQNLVQPLFKIEGDLYMGDKVMNSTFNAGRDIRAQNIAGGDVIGIANAAVQDLSKNDAGTAEILRQMLTTLETSDVADESRERIVTAVETVARNPAREERGALLRTVRSVKEGMEAAGASVDMISKVLALAMQLSA